MPKVQNDLTKLKHPNSRKTASVVKQIIKKKKRNNTKLCHAMKQNLIGEKLQWFKERLLLDVKRYTPEQTADIINKYLSRFNEELEQIQIKHSIGNRKNRQHANREDIINLTIKRETDEFNTCGIELPDLMNEGQLELLKKWNGELRYLQNFKLRRIAKKHLSEEKQRMLNKMNDKINNVQSDVETK